jgi:hypothetical protein
VEGDHERERRVRARRHVQDAKPRFEASRARKEELARRFFEAAREGDLDGLVGMLAADAVIYGDGGGKAPAVAQPINGRDRVARFLLGLARQARQLGLTAKILGSNATSNRTYPATVGPAAEGVMNVVTLAALPEVAGGDARMQDYVRRFTARLPDLARQNRPDLGDCLGYSGALVFLEGLRRAGPQLTREGFIRALEGIRDFETGIGLPTTFGPDRHEGNLAARVLEFQPDLSRKLTDYMLRAPGTAA